MSQPPTTLSPNYEHPDCYREVLCPEHDRADLSHELLPLLGSIEECEQAESLRDIGWSMIVLTLARAKALGRTHQRHIDEARMRAMRAFNRHQKATWWIDHSGLFITDETCDHACHSPT